jgi:pimeloyl-ACP methyl ester carboxylesterase
MSKINILDLILLVCFTLSMLTFLELVQPAQAAPSLISSPFPVTSLTLDQIWQREGQATFERGSSVYSTLPGKGARHVLFVAGVMNELTVPLENYFPDNIRSIERELGYSHTQFRPSSRKSVPTNAEIIFAKINEIYNQVQKPLIIVAHSKGAAETFYCILAHPELILGGKVDRVILYQASIGGSPIADGKHARALRFFSQFVRPDMATLGTAAAKKNVNRAYYRYESFFRDYVDARGGSRTVKTISSHRAEKMKQFVSNRIFYIRSATPHGEWGWAVRLVRFISRKSLTPERSNDGIHPLSPLAAKAITQYSGLNDGLLPVESQMDVRIGVDLGILEADHTALTVSKMHSGTANLRRALMRAALCKVYESSF